MASDVLLYIQPAYNCLTNTIEYAEVLIRRYKGIESVAEILKFVCSNELEKKFDLDVIKEVVNCIKDRELPYPIGVNLCPNTIKCPDIVNNITKLLDENNIKYSNIIIEINESTDFTDDKVYNNISKLHNLGFKLALDDFGVEKANLYSIVHYKFDILKVDKSFIGHEREESKSQILSIIKEICSKFNMKPIIEGVENKRQLSKISDMGYTLVQGYIYTEPIPLKEFMLA